MKKKVKKAAAKKPRINIANMITLSRMALAPVIAATFFLDRAGMPLFYARIITIALIIIAELTDAFDGYAARKFGQVSDMGKILDPFADSFYRFTIFATFMATGYFPLWILLVFFYRDSIVSTLRILSGLSGVALAARMSGKIKAWVQAVGTFAVLALDLMRFNPFVNFDRMFGTAIPYQPIMFWVFAVVAAYTLYSGIDYLAGSYKLWGRLIKS
ncbi:MAG: CDP-diacylglycerol--glycerol-3-phosphate 3-phosphatidyltransferase [Spirochaetes bacterium]|nr:CDP-diacylglycerol--glycerol-3-phosphate 3-phosphatidyltransferase [Spirochaetota bacterium]